MIEALRAEMPERFKWDFETSFECRGCGYVGCAMGLAHQIGIVPKPPRNTTYPDLMSEALGLRYSEVRRIFVPYESVDGRCEGYGVSYEQVTPQMVADKLEAI